MAKWIIKTPILERASRELALLFKNPDLKREIFRVMNLLAEQDNPRKPDKSLNLDVRELEHDAPGWYRVSLLPAFNARIIFRLLVVRNEHLVELDRYELANGEEKYIDIVKVAYRDKNTYGRDLRQRYKKLHGE